MKNYEGFGYAIGALVGAVVGGVGVYFTKSILLAPASLVCAFLGGQIGKAIKKPEK